MLRQRHLLTRLSTFALISGNFRAVTWRNRWLLVRLCA
jgi:hypothetical protein